MSMSFCAQVSQSEQERRASALGYVTQAVLQLAAVLDVPLRYPVAPGASRSYICDLQPTWAGGSSRTVSFFLYSYWQLDRRHVLCTGTGAREPVSRGP